ncbi:MAG: crotonase/enoyl-CoA hydratase family protein [Actinomycetota bacterium]|nr:crotonase/enoyl-CoA hydratase family protein [Actinomycetota bacterium]
MSDRVTVSVTDGVADVRMNRPDKLNALDPAMFAALGEAGDAIAADPSVRAVVLSGEGRGFCAGLDFGSFQSMAERGGPKQGDGDGGGERKVDLGARPEGRITNTGQHAVYVWTSMPAPVIAAVHGVALGGGCQIALGADLRIVAPDARMSVLEIRWGLVPDMCGTQLLPRLVGLDVAKELTFTGRMVEGTEAVQIGLATKLSDDPRAAALEMAGEIAAKNPHAVRGAKSLLELAGEASLEDGFKAEERTISSLIGTPNQVEAVMAYFEKRDPVFTDPTP